MISSIQLTEAQEEERRSGEPLRKVVLRLGIISEDDLVSFIAAQMDIPRIELANYLIDVKVLELIPEDLARKHQLIPILKIGNCLTCAMVDVFNIYALDEVSLKTGLTIEPAITTEAELRSALNEHFSLQGSLQDLISGFQSGASRGPHRLFDNRWG